MLECPCTMHTLHATSPGVHDCLGSLVVACTPHLQSAARLRVYTTISLSPLLHAQYRSVQDSSTHTSISNKFIFVPGIE